MIRPLRTTIAALGILVAAGAARLAGDVLPADLAMAVGLAVAIGIPGWAVLGVSGLRARLDTPSALAVLPVAGLSAWIVPLAFGFAVGLPFEWVLFIVLALAALGLGATSMLQWGVWPSREVAGVGAGGVALGLAALHWQPTLMGDALYHAGVIRKLLALPSLSLSGISPFFDGHAHAGYAFPLLHAVQAGACELTGVDGSVGYAHLVAGFAFLLVPAVYGGGRALGGPAVGTLGTLLAVWDVASRNELGLLNQPPFFTFLIAFPAIVVLLAELHRDQTDRRLTAAVVVSATVVAILHPTYALPSLAILTATIVISPRAWRALAGAVITNAAMFGFIYLVALRGATRSGTIPVTQDDFMVWHHHVISLSGRQVLQFRVEFLVALVAAPVLLLRHRQMVLTCTVFAGGLALTSFPGVGGVMSDVIGVGQSTRMWEAIPWVFVTASVVVLAARRLHGWKLVGAVVVLALGSRLIEGHEWMWGQKLAEFDMCPTATVFSAEGTLSLPNVLAALSAIGCVIGVARRRGDLPTSRAVFSAPLLATALLFVAMMAGPWDLYGRPVLSGLIDGKSQQYLLNQETPGLVSFMDTHDHPFPVVLAPYSASPKDWYSGIAYQLVGHTDVYVVAISEPHTRANPLDDPHQRRVDVTTFLDPATTEAHRDAIIARYHVTYVAMDLKTTAPSVITALRSDTSLRQVYQDGPTPRNEGRFLVLATA